MSHWPLRVRSAVFRALQESAWVVRTDHRGDVWIVRRDWESALASPASADWFDLESHPGAKLVKEGQARSIWRVPLGKRALFVKRYEAHGLRGLLKTILIGGQAEREWRTVLDVERLGVPAVRAAALASRGGRAPAGMLFLIEEERVETLRDAWHRRVAGTRGRDRRARVMDLIEPVARLLSTAHRRGFMHRDAHPDNILLRMREGGRIEAIFSDLHGGTIAGRAATRQEAAANLAHLDQFFHRVATRTERLRFLATHLSQAFGSDGTANVGEGPEGGRLPSGILRIWVETTVQASRAHAAALARRRDARLTRNPKYFAMLDLGDGWRAHVVLRLERRHVFPDPTVPDRDERQWRDILAQLLRAVRDGAPDAVVDGVRWELVEGGAGVEGQHWRLRGSAAQSRFEECHRLRHRDVNVPLILGYLEHRAGLKIDRAGVLRPA